ncbi:MAG TPA: vWA domain-containing protein [Polyangiaceae bacterium]|nr:vWA domain-containing protein [Polyangiaceae bacterium]
MRIASMASLALLCALGGCSDSKGKSEETSMGDLHTVDVCAADGPLGGKCGDSCKKTADCPGGQYCEDGACKAQCTASAGCVGTCTQDGHCDGQLQQVISLPDSPAEQGDVITDPSEGPASSGAFASCATGTAVGELTPVSLFVMFDNSLSMADNDKWNQAADAIQKFFQDPDTAGLGIALRFFGNNPTVGCDGEACTNQTIDACADPQVPLGVLTQDTGAADAQETALVSAVDNANPDFAGTPMFAALSGAVTWATAHQSQNPEGNTVVVFVTDGVPQYQDCSENIDDIAQLAADGQAAGVRTYAIGLEGSQEAQMDRIAEAGGTGQGIFIGSGNAGTALLDALKAIRGQVASCDVQMPKASSGALDPSKVNVTLTLGGKDVALGQLPKADACGDDGAWYYDDPANPTRILLCPKTCDAVQADPSSRIDIVLGCMTSNVTGPLAR